MPDAKSTLLTLGSENLLFAAFCDSFSLSGCA
jgi:hypothetical protein